MCKKEEGEDSDNAQRRELVEMQCQAGEQIAELFLGGEDSDFPVSTSLLGPPGSCPEPQQGQAGLPRPASVQGVARCRCVFPAAAVTASAQGLPWGLGQCLLQAVRPRRWTCPWAAAGAARGSRVCSAPASGSHGLRRGK